MLEYPQNYIYILIYITIMFCIQYHFIDSRDMDAARKGASSFKGLQKMQLKTRALEKALLKQYPPPKKQPSAPALKPVPELEAEPAGAGAGTGAEAASAAPSRETLALTSSKAANAIKAVKAVRAIKAEGVGSSSAAPVGKVAVVVAGVAGAQKDSTKKTSKFSSKVKSTFPPHSKAGSKYAVAMAVQLGGPDKNPSVVSVF